MVLIKVRYSSDGDIALAFAQAVQAQVQADARVASGNNALTTTLSGITTVDVQPPQGDGFSSTGDKFYLYQKAPKGITSISTLNGTFRLTSEYTEAVKKFEEETGLKALKIDAIKHPVLSQIVESSMHYNLPGLNTSDSTPAELTQMQDLTNLDRQKSYASFYPCQRQKMSSRYSAHKNRSRHCPVHFLPAPGRQQACRPARAQRRGCCSSRSLAVRPPHPPPPSSTVTAASITACASQVHVLASCSSKQQAKVMLPSCKRSWRRTSTTSIGVASTECLPCM